MSDRRQFTILKSHKPLGAAFSHAKKVAAKNGGGKKKEREVANRYLRENGEETIGKSDAADMLTGYVAKGGIGSRGGHQIGTTKSGKPIYESHHARYASMHVHESGSIGDDAKRVDGSFTHYSAADHEDAASAHFKQAYEADHARGQPTPKGEQHMRAARAHNRLANTMAVKKSQTESFVTEVSPMNAADLLGAYLVKGGAGSRGGKVVGTTRNGKPIYAARSASSGSYKMFTAQDHSDAAKAHLEAAKDTSLSTAQKMQHRDQALGHKQAADQQRGDAKTRRLSIAANRAGMMAQKSLLGTDHENALEAIGGYLIKGGEGSRGGKIIGHTKSGKPIYEHSNGKFYDHRGTRIYPLENGDGSKKWVTVPESDDATSPNKIGKAYDMSFGKSGEGSRGGKIIGHTKSGKAVYQHFYARHPEYSGFSKQDHKDAENLHVASAKPDSRGMIEYTESNRTKLRHAGSHWKAADKMKKSDGDGDAAHQFADLNNSDSDRILVRPVMDVENSPLNDAIAAAWPGMPFMAQSAANFCNLDALGKLGD